MMQGTSMMKAITTGSNIVQEKDINWSNRILGNEALTHMKTNIIAQDLRPIVKPNIIPSIRGSDNIDSPCTDEWYSSWDTGPLSTKYPVNEAVMSDK